MWEWLSELDGSKNPSETLRNLITGCAIVVGGFGGLYALYLSDARKANDRNRLGNETFTRAVELLGHEKERAQIGAIKAIGQIGIDDKRLLRAAIDTLCGFVQQETWSIRNSPKGSSFARQSKANKNVIDTSTVLADEFTTKYPEQETNSDGDLLREPTHDQQPDSSRNDNYPPLSEGPRPDAPPVIQSAITVLGRQLLAHWARLEQQPKIHFHEETRKRVSIDFLRGWRNPLPQLPQPDLRTVKFDGVDFDGTVFRNIVFHNSEFIQTRMYRADFSNSVLQEAKFQSPDLREARFVGADCQNATFTNCHFSKNSFAGANCRGVTYKECKWEDVDFTGADLRGAIFYRSTDDKAAGLSTVNFTGANLADVKWGEMLMLPLNHETHSDHN